MERLNQWLSLLTNFGVLVSIAFLAVEINQNSEQLSLSSYQISTERYADLIVNVTQDPEKFHGFKHALNCFDASDSEDQALFHSHVYKTITAINHSQRLLDAGVIPETVVIGQKQDLARVLKSPGGRQWMDSLGVDPESQFLKDVFVVGADQPPLNEQLPFFRPDQPNYCGNI